MNGKQRRKRLKRTRAWKLARKERRKERVQKFLSFMKGKIAPGIIERIFIESLFPKLLTKDLP